MTLPVCRTVTVTAVPLSSSTPFVSKTGMQIRISTYATSLTSTVFTSCRSAAAASRSEEHTSELQSRLHLVCRLLLEKKKKKRTIHQAVLDKPQHQSRTDTP